jgi:hypothetical protein
LADAREGRSGVLLVRGEPGIGKSALLDHTVQHAHGFTVVSARGVESEAELAFAGLADLTRPLLGYLPGLPNVQAAALKGALALGPPVAGDRFTIAVATLTLLGAAEQEPLLVVVDDAHWLDSPSAEVVGFVARRLQAEGIVLLLAMRDGEASAVDVAGLAELKMQGLNPVDAEALLRQQQTAPIAAGVAAQLARATAGNPLALLEVPALLSSGQLAGTVPLEEPLPAGDSIARAFLRRVAKLATLTLTALLVAAASDTGDLAIIVGAASQLGADTIALEAAEAAGLVHLGRLGLEFRHPLLRAAIYHGATPQARRDAHRPGRRLSTGRRRRPGRLATGRRHHHPRRTSRRGARADRTTRPSTGRPCSRRPHPGTRRPAQPRPHRACPPATRRRQGLLVRWSPQQCDPHVRPDPSPSRRPGEIRYPSAPSPWEAGRGKMC